MDKVYELLNKSEETKNIRFNRTERGFSISCFGYVHQDLMDLEAELVKLGCRYDHASGVIQDFDRVSGRTFTHMYFPKAVSNE